MTEEEEGEEEQEEGKEEEEEEKEAATEEEEAAACVLNIPMSPPLTSAAEAGLWVEEPATQGQGGASGSSGSPDGLSSNATGHSRPAQHPTLVLSRVNPGNPGGVELQRFTLPIGAPRPQPKSPTQSTRPGARPGCISRDLLWCEKVGIERERRFRVYY